jgi:hypothetical protein
MSAITERHAKEVLHQSITVAHLASYNVASSCDVNKQKSETEIYRRDIVPAQQKQTAAPEGRKSNKNIVS